MGSCGNSTNMLHNLYDVLVRVVNIKEFFQIISLLYLLFLLYGFLVISNFNLYLTLFYGIPIVFWVIWAKIKKESWDIYNKNNRIVPLTITTLYIFLLSLFWHNIFNFIFLGNVLLILIITKFWKISMHCYGLSAMSYLIYKFTGNVFLFVIYIFLLIITIYARIYLKKHTYSQVLVGTLLGFLFNYVLLNVLR